MPGRLKVYSKWFRFLYWLFWPITILSLFSFGENLFTFAIVILDTIYIVLLLATFLIESVFHFHASSKKSK